MNSDLQQIILKIKEKTAIDISVYSETEKTLEYSVNEAEFKLPSKADFSDVFLDLKNKHTYFRFCFKGVDYIGAIAGASEIQNNYAYFILSFLENSGVKEVNYGKSEYVKNILLGNCTHQQIQKFINKFSYPQKRCYVVVFSVEETKMEELLSYFANFIPNSYDYATEMSDTICAYVKFIDDSIDEQPIGEYIETLCDSIEGETGIVPKVGIGGSVESIPYSKISYEQALEAVQFAEIYNSKTLIHSYKEFVWIKILQTIPKYQIMQYLSILEDKTAKTIFDDEDMIATAEEFLENNLNISETSRKLFMHRNTLMYRLDKIEKITGLNVKKFSDAVTFRMIRILNKLINS